MGTDGRHPLQTWLAILAILLNALAPAMTHALARSGSDAGLSVSSTWFEVCSAQGTTWARLAPNGSLIEKTSKRPADAPATSHDPHCPYCVTHAASFGMLPPPVAVAPAWALTFELSPSQQEPAHDHAAWLAPAARAPPSLY